MKVFSPLHKNTDSRQGAVKIFAVAVTTGLDENAIHGGKTEIELMRELTKGVASTVNGREWTAEADDFNELPDIENQIQDNMCNATPAPTKSFRRRLLGMSDIFNVQAAQASPLIVQYCLVGNDTLSSVLPDFMFKSTSIFPIFPESPTKPPSFAPSVFPTFIPSSSPTFARELLSFN